MTLLCRVRIFTVFKKVKCPERLYARTAAVFIDVSLARWYKRVTTPIQEVKDEIRRT
jgi:hypothetical protein